MNLITQRREDAMLLTDQALDARRHGRIDAARQLFTEAMQAERAEAELASEGSAGEPTRSVLYRSAAALALDAVMPGQAERLAAIGLAGAPPLTISEELKGLMAHARRERQRVAPEPGNPETLAAVGVTHLAETGTH